MILAYIMDLFLTIGEWIVASIPTIELPVNIDNYIAPLANFIGYIDTFVVIEIIALCITTIIIADNWALVVKLAVKIWSLLPLT